MNPVRRSHRANQYYWSALIKPIAKALGVSYDAAHAFMKTEFNSLRVVVGDRELRRAVSTVELSPREFYRYIDRVKRFARRELGLQIVTPWVVPDLMPLRKKDGRESEPKSPQFQEFAPGVAPRMPHPLENLTNE